MLVVPKSIDLGTISLPIHGFNLGQFEQSTASCKTRHVKKDQLNCKNMTNKCTFTKYIFNLFFSVVMLYSIYIKKKKIKNNTFHPPGSFHITLKYCGFSFISRLLINRPFRAKVKKDIFRSPLSGRQPSMKHSGTDVM